MGALYRSGCIEPATTSYDCGGIAASSLRKTSEARTCRCQARHWGKTMASMSKSSPCRPQASAESRAVPSSSCRHGWVDLKELGVTGFGCSVRVMEMNDARL
jgi:hypothetical protein